MLIEVGIMFASYMGIRLYENYHNQSKSKKQLRQEQQAIKIKNTELENSSHYLIISTISIGLAAMRSFYPIIAPFSLGVYIYTAIPFMRHVEKTLLKERKVDVDVLFFNG